MPVIPSTSASPRVTARNLLTSISHTTSSLPHYLKRTLSSLTNPQPLTKRQQGTTVAIPTVYQGLNDGPAPGTVVGIVLGSVAGFLLIVWLLYSLTNSGKGANNISGEEQFVVERGPRSRKSRQKSRRSESMGGVSRSPRRGGGGVIVEERRTSMPPPPPMAMPMPPPAPRSVILEERTERRVSGDDIVEVVEEYSDVAPPRRKERRHSRRGSGSYRPVDPDQYAGGDYPPRRVGGRRY